MCIIKQFRNQWISSSEKWLVIAGTQKAITDSGKSNPGKTGTFSLEKLIHLYINKIHCSISYYTHHKGNKKKFV